MVKTADPRQFKHVLRKVHEVRLNFRMNATVRLNIPFFGAKPLTIPSLNPLRLCREYRFNLCDFVELFPYMEIQ